MKAVSQMFAVIWDKEEGNRVCLCHPGQKWEMTKHERKQKKILSTVHLFGGPDLWRNQSDLFGLWKIHDLEQRWSETTLYQSGLLWKISANDSEEHLCELCT